MRGEVYRARFDGRGHEQHGDRYAVVLQAHALRALSTWIVAPTTASPNAQAALYRPEVIIEGRPGLILIEQARAFDHSRLGTAVDMITPEQLWAVDIALKLLFDL